MRHWWMAGVLVLTLGHTGRRKVSVGPPCLARRLRCAALGPCHLSASHSGFGVKGGGGKGLFWRPYLVMPWVEGKHSAQPSGLGGGLAGIQSQCRCCACIKQCVIGRGARVWLCLASRAKRVCLLFPPRSRISGGTEWNAKPFFVALWAQGKKKKKQESDHKKRRLHMPVVLYLLGRMSSTQHVDGSEAQDHLDRAPRLASRSIE